MQVCPVCQRQNPPGVEYCEDCGTALGAPAGQQAAAPAPPSAPRSGTASQASSAAGDAEGAAATASPAATATAPTRTAGSTPAPVNGASATPIPDEQAPSAGDAATAAATPAGAGTTAASAVAPPAAPTGATGRPRLLARRHGAMTGEEIPLLGDRLVVGRFDPDTGPVDIDLSSAPEAQHISRQHGELYRESDGRWFVRDLGSTNGVFVKGENDGAFGPRITAPRALSDGDEVAFGNARFVFRAG